jgi:hypothetical protein
MFFPHLLSSHHKSTQPCLRHCFRLHGRVEPEIPARWRWGKLGGLSSDQVCGSCTTLSFNFAIFCSVIFFRPPGHYVRDITLLNRTFYLFIILLRCVWLNILGTRIEASVLCFLEPGYDTVTMDRRTHRGLRPLSHLVLRPNQMLIVCVPRNQVYTHTVQKMDTE